MTISNEELANLLTQAANAGLTVRNTVTHDLTAEELAEFTLRYELPDAVREAKRLGESSVRISFEDAHSREHVALRLIIEKLRAAGFTVDGPCSGNSYGGSFTEWSTIYCTLMV